MNILFGICSIGLGHATRDLPLINALLKKGHKVTIISSGRPLILLRKELKKSCHYFDVPDYPLPYLRKRFSTAMMPFYFPKMLQRIFKEQQFVKKLCKKNKFNRIISDNRFGIYHEKIPSYFVSHQLSFVTRKALKPFAVFAEFINYLLQKNFKYCIVPDYKTNSLSGIISHNLKVFPSKRVKYIGILSSAEREKSLEDIDYFISISGPEPQRLSFQKKVLPQLEKLSGKIVVTLGKPESSKKIFKKTKNITIYNYLNRKEQASIMNRSKFIVARSGYTTLMELVELEKKALFVPTPGQVEQVYLSELHSKKRTFLSVPEKKLNLKHDIERAKKYPGFKTREKTASSVKNFLKLIGA